MCPTGTTTLSISMRCFTPTPALTIRQQKPYPSTIDRPPPRTAPQAASLWSYCMRVRRCVASIRSCVSSTHLTPERTSPAGVLTAPQHPISNLSLFTFPARPGQARQGTAMSRYISCASAATPIRTRDGAHIFPPLIICLCLSVLALLILFPT